MEKIRFICAGTVPGEQYTKEESLRLLNDFQDEIIRDYRSRFSKSLFNRKYFSRNLEYTAGEYRLDEDLSFQGLKKDLDGLGGVITALRSDISGMERVRRAMSRTLPGEEMEVLYGVSVPDGKGRTDIDAVVITPYGVFAIEVWSRSASMLWDEKSMNCKELLLRDKLKDYPNVPLYSILLLTDNRVQITNRYNRIPVSYLNVIMGDIRSYSDGVRYITRKQMQGIRETLTEDNAPARIACPADCRRIADEYARFVGRCAAKEPGNKKSVWGSFSGFFGRRAVHGADVEAVKICASGDGFAKASPRCHEENVTNRYVPVLTQEVKSWVEEMCWCWVILAWASPR